MTQDDAIVYENIVNDDIDDDDIARPRIVKIVLSDISGDVRGLLDCIKYDNLEIHNMILNIDETKIHDDEKIYLKIF